MYAIIDDNGKQYKAAEGDSFEVDLRAAQPGDEVSFDRVLLVSGDDTATVGTPTIEGAAVRAEVLGDTKGKKVVVQHFRRRQGRNRTRRGHRQPYTRVKIKQIVLPGQSAGSTDEATEGGIEDGS